MARFEARSSHMSIDASIASTIDASLFGDPALIDATTLKRIMANGGMTQEIKAIVASSQPEVQHKVHSLLAQFRSEHLARLRADEALARARVPTIEWVNGRPFFRACDESRRDHQRRLDVIERRVQLGAGDVMSESDLAATTHALRVSRESRVQAGTAPNVVVEKVR
jgi:hypothetical protein